VKCLTLFLAALSAAVFLVKSATADEWPNKPVKVVVPFAPGGTADVLGRIVSQSLSDQFKQPFYVENRSGAAGMIGVKLVAASNPDGYTLVLCGASGREGFRRNRPPPLQTRNAIEAEQFLTLLAPITMTLSIHLFESGVSVVIGAVPAV
jgi:hypothetical protein